MEAQNAANADRGTQQGVATPQHSPLHPPATPFQSATARKPQGTRTTGNSTATRHPRKSTQRTNSEDMKPRQQRATLQHPATNPLPTPIKAANGQAPLRRQVLRGRHGITSGRRSHGGSTTSSNTDSKPLGTTPNLLHCRRLSRQPHLSSAGSSFPARQCSPECIPGSVRHPPRHRHEWKNWE